MPSSKQTTEDVIASILDMVSAGNVEQAVAMFDETPNDYKSTVLAAVFEELNMSSVEDSRLMSDMRRKLRKYEEQEDLYAPSLIDGIISSIVDGQSAFVASNNYDLTWFRSLYFSDMVKTDIANRLINVVEKYNASYVPLLWKNLSSGNPETMAAVNLLPYDEDEEEESDE